MEKLSLSDLLLFIKAGDADAFRELYHRYKEKTYWIIYRRLGNEEEAKDMVQEIFLSLWTGRERLAGLEILDTYLYGMARNKIISLYRKKHIKFKGEHYLYSQTEQLDASADEYLIARELNDKVEDVVSRLPATMRACFQLNKNLA
jgi:RNA polymerase sigma factor (sigma-70 family)